MKIDLFRMSGTGVLAGAVSGQQLLVRLLGVTNVEPKSPEPVYLDFSRIEVATASYLRESVLKFRDLIRNARSNFYPAIANANSVVREELTELLKTRGGVFACCTLSSESLLSDIQLIGDLDPKAQLTFDYLNEFGEADAGQLMDRHGQHEGVQRTAWNNRLAALSESGVIVEVRYGRSKRYRPLFSGVH